MRISWILSFVCVLSCSSLTWPDEVTCGPTAADAYRLVRVALGQEDWRAALEATAHERGPDIVLCVLREVAASKEPEALRAREFLAERLPEFR